MIFQLNYNPKNRTYYVWYFQQTGIKENEMANIATKQTKYIDTTDRSFKDR